MICFQLPMLYLAVGNLEEGYRLTQDAIMMSDAMEWDGYIPAIRLTDVMCEVYHLNIDAATEKLEYAKRILTEKPWQRELAYAEVIEGYLHLMRGDEARGADGVLAGLRHLEDARLCSHAILRTNQALHIAQHVLPSPSLARRLWTRWSALSHYYGFPRLLHDIEKAFTDNLGLDFL